MTFGDDGRAPFWHTEIEQTQRAFFTKETGGERTGAGPAVVDPDEKDASAVPDKPACPNCGWHDVRPSVQKGLLDRFLVTLSFLPFRCRACGHRFHSFRRAAGN